ncbi:putative deoxyribonuclease TATDN2 [Mercenaria mercenaria]|uniref:putative deoxyribonuclease TATDN2 n=1 Tax=Mercenaria mercenaria TaxID=6596 RepID=UPI00234E86EB|nr:putative deoxyribonuclease TATDN2 [Mercenaria mercenaria]
MSVAIGFHPKHASSSHHRLNEDIKLMLRLLRHPKVSAFGEIGIDHTEPRKDWSYQVDLLEKILPELQDQHVLIVHCRGMRGDCGTEAFLLLLHFLKKLVRTNHPIHLHCFAGNQYVFKRWLEVFPRTYIGFTNMVQSFDPEQVAALCAIEENRLLLESDAPYFKTMGTNVSSPSQLYAAAMNVAQHRGTTPERSLEITVANAQCLYHDQFQ